MEITREDVKRVFINDFFSREKINITPLEKEKIAGLVYDVYMWGRKDQKEAFKIKIEQKINELFEK